MKQDVSRTKEFRKYYLSEFELYDGEEFITFNIVHIDTEKRKCCNAMATTIANLRKKYSTASTKSGYLMPTDK